MNEGRIVLCVFGAAAVLMIALPVATLLMPTSVVSTDAAMQADVSRFFVAATKPNGPGPARQTLPDIVKLFPPGTPDKTVFARFAESGFTCVPDADAASCFRAGPAPASSTCRADWRAYLTFDAAGRVTTSEADIRTTCL